MPQIEHGSVETDSEHENAFGDTECSSRILEVVQRSVCVAVILTEDVELLSHESRRMS